jgi:hypothetical protein
MKLPKEDTMATQKVNVTQTKLGYLLINGEQVKVLSPRLRNKPLDQWQQEIRMEELEYMQEDADRAVQRAKQAELEAVRATVEARLHGAWGRWETKAGHRDLTFGRFGRDTGVLVPRGTAPTPNPMTDELCNRVFVATCDAEHGRSTRTTNQTKRSEVSEGGNLGWTADPKAGSPFRQSAKMPVFRVFGPVANLAISRSCMARWS